MRHAIPDFSLVVLIGATGSGKSTFATKHFSQSEVVSSDACRAVVSDDANSQAASGDAFDLVRFIAEKRLKNRRLTVIDATNVRAADRRSWIEVARRWHALPVAIVLDPGLDVCVERNKLRPDRQFGPQIPQRMIGEIRKGLRGLEREGFRRVLVLRSVEDIEAAEIAREPLWTDKRADTGPFDIIGDVHGCGDELETLLARLGYVVRWSDADSERSVTVEPPPGRKVVFVGDLVDRGPTYSRRTSARDGDVRGGQCVLRRRQPRKQTHALDGRTQRKNWPRPAANYRPIRSRNSGLPREGQNLSH